MTAPVVSVVIATRDDAGLVGGAVRSVLGQTYPHVDIVVVDDGSVDDTAAVLAGFGERIRWVSQPPRGLAAARNRGLGLARGAYLCVLDADDRYEPGFVATLLAALRGDPTAAGAYCRYRFVDEAGRVLPQRAPAPVSPDELYARLCGGNLLVPEAMLLQRSCYDSVGPFDESLDVCEDWDLWLRVARRYRVVGVDAELSCHGVRGGSMSSDPARMQEGRLRVLRKHFGAAEAARAESPVRDAYARAYLRAAIDWLEQGDQATAVECIHHMVSLHPSALADLEPFYELGCGIQPRGHHGDLATLDVERSAAVLVGCLDAVFARPSVAAGLRAWRGVAYANAYLTLARFSRGQRRVTQTHRYLWHSLLAWPRGSLRSQWWRTLAGAWRAVGGIG